MPGTVYVPVYSVHSPTVWETVKVGKVEVPFPVSILKVNSANVFISCDVMMVVPVIGSVCDSLVPN